MFNQITPNSTSQGRGLRTTRPVILMIILLAWIGLPVVAWPPPCSLTTQAGDSARVSAQRADEALSLEPGKPIERELSGGQSHSYKITMTPGQYLHIVVKQRGIDVAVALFTPDGKKFGEADSEQVTEGSESISAISEMAGAYLIEVRFPEKTAEAGHYEIKIEELRSATAADRYRVAGDVIFREADQLRNGTLEAKRKSIEKYHEALDLYRRAGDRSNEAVTLGHIGSVYESLGEMLKALEKNNEALPIFQALGDRNEEASILNNIGLIYWSLGEMHKALEKFNEALPIFQAVGDRGGEAFALNNIGLIYWSLGEAQKALEKFNEALPIFHAVGERKGEAITLNNIGEIYRSLGEVHKALEKYIEALPIRRAVGDRSGEAVTLNNIGLAYRSVGDMQKALEKYNEALLIFQAVGDRNGEAVTLNNIGSVYRSLGETQKALEKYNEALPIFQAVGNRSRKAATLNNIGLVYWSLGEAQKALEKNNEALPIFQAVGDRNGEAAALLGIARVEQKHGNLTQARQTIEQAIGLIESLRTNITSRALRASYFASRQDFFESYIAVLMEQHKQNPAAGFDAVAFAVSERARARSLLELLTESSIDVRQGVDSSLLERERSLRRRLAARAAAQTNLLNRKHTPEQAEAAAKEIASITAEYEELQGKIRDSSPKYAALTQPQPLNMSEIQKQVLDPETLLLEYSLGENASYLFAVSQTSIASYQLPKRAEIERGDAASA